MSNKPPSPHDPANFEPTLNGIVYSVCKILRNIMVSAAEAELGALFLNYQEAVPIRITLEEMGHSPPPTPVQVDKSTALGISTVTIKQRKSKATDMRFYWIRDRTNIKKSTYIGTPVQQKKEIISLNTFPPPTTQQYAQVTCT